MRREYLSLENFPASFGHPAWKDYSRHLMSSEHTRSRVLGLKEIICNIISTSQVGPSFCLIRSFCIKQISLGCLESFYNKEKQNFRPGKSCTHLDGVSYNKSCLLFSGKLVNDDKGRILTFLGMFHYTGKESARGYCINTLHAEFWKHLCLKFCLIFLCFF